MKDPISSATHLGGFLAAVVGLVVLVMFSAHDAAKLTAMSLYGVSLVSVFLASAAYHFFDVGERWNLWLRRLDHGAIFLLIAGTYVPVLIHTLDGAWRIGMLAAVGGLAAVGIGFKLAWIHCPEWLGTTIYLALGWIVLIPLHRILPHLDWAQLILLVAGGLTYTAGAAVFVWERPNPWPDRFGHHEIWHLFVLTAAALHFLFVLTFLGQPYAPF